MFECHEGQARVHLHHALGHMPKHLPRHFPNKTMSTIFMTKFLNLLQSGRNAHLVFNSYDGQAFVSVHHKLGHLHQQHPNPASYERQQHQHHHQSPSRLQTT